MRGLVLAILASLSLVQGNVFTVDLAQLAVERLDPIVFNGQSPEGHMHSICGASGFSKAGTFGELIGSSCTTGNVKKDLSNYWVPALYVKKPNGVSMKGPIHLWLTMPPPCHGPVDPEPPAIILN